MLNKNIKIALSQSYVSGGRDIIALRLSSSAVTRSARSLWSISAEGYCSRKTGDSCWGQVILRLCRVDNCGLELLRLLTQMASSEVTM